ncbi:hypothetical protein G7Y89_g8521 [Cudoniella acicularis]|uniref:Nucleoside phosphorylase domain-containing protein n=1 Tax=Cudoniella acicularis TaxID=354080 RepID=A0A8H4W0J2_9HELO|nr:hypothetical protein G7Y89_g8521 [Cudoniella acicularis]
MPPTLSYEDYTVGWICALQIEVEAAIYMLDEKHEGRFPGRLGDDNNYIPGTVNGHNVVIVGLPKKSVGTVSAASLVSQMRQSFHNIRYGLMVGIGAGVPGRDLKPDIRLGDIVVATPANDSDDASGVIDYELGKESVEGFVKKNALYPTDRRIRNALGTIQAEAHWEGSYRFVQYLEAFRSRPNGHEFFYPGVQHDQLYRCDNNSIPMVRNPRNSQDPVVHYGLIASGNKVVKNAKLRDDLRDKYNIICFEMETAGIINTLPVAVIRGISDYADAHKNDLWHRYAAATAAAYSKWLLYKIGPDPLANPPSWGKGGDSTTISSVSKSAQMNFGYSAEDADMLFELAQDTLRHVRTQNEELTREVASIYRVLKRLRRSLANPDFLLGRADDDRRQDLDDLGRSCEQILNAVNLVVTKYDHRSARKIGPKAKVQPDEMQDLASIKVRLSAHKKAIRMTLHPHTSRSQSKVGKELDSLEELDGIRDTIGPIAAQIARQTHDESEWTSYKEDDSGFWRDLRRQLVKKGYGSYVLRKHEHLIKQYLVELGQEGALDQNDEIPVDTRSIDADNFQHGRSKGPLVSVEEAVDENGEEKRHLDAKDAGRQCLESQGVTGQADDLLDASQLSTIDVLNYLQPSAEEEVISTESVVPNGQSWVSDLPLFENFQDMNEPIKKPEEHLVSPWSDQVGESPDSSFCPSVKGADRKYPKAVQVEDVLDEDFMPGAHKMVYSEEEFESETADHKDRSLLNRLERSSISMVEIREQKPKQQIPEYLRVTPNYVFWETGTLDLYGARLKPKTVKVKDAVGRKFSFPFHLCKTWKGMEKLLNTAFEQVEILGPHVIAGHYDLINEDGQIILPVAWEHLVEPDWRITMHMWPLPDTCPLPKQPAKQEALQPPPPPPPKQTTPASTSTTTPPLSPGALSDDLSKVPRRMSTPTPPQTPSKGKSSTAPAPEAPSFSKSDSPKKSTSKDRQGSKSKKQKPGEPVKTTGSVLDWMRGKSKQSSKGTSTKRDPAKSP